MISTGIGSLYGVINQNKLQEEIGEQILKFTLSLNENDFERSEKIIKDLTSNHWEETKSYIKGLKFLHQVLGGK